MCGGFSCSKNALIALNTLYMVINFSLHAFIGYVHAFACHTQNHRTKKIEKLTQLTLFLFR